VLFLGRLTAQKGPLTLIEAAARVLRSRPETLFLVCGGGDLLPRMVERAAELGIGASVRFTGTLAPAEVQRAFARATLFVLPSTSEPFGIAALEALAAGVPVLLSRQSGVAEVLPSAPRFDAWDVAGLAAETERLLGSPELRARALRACRAEARRLDWDDSAAALLRVYRELVA
jgi:glycosyltransferase involved in cell wall biosynthesis